MNIGEYGDGCGVEPEVGGGEDADDAGLPQRVGGVDAGDAGVRHRRSDVGDVQGTVEQRVVDVAHERRRAGQQARVLTRTTRLPRTLTAPPLAVRYRRDPGSLRSQHRGRHHRQPQTGGCRRSRTRCRSPNPTWAATPCTSRQPCCTGWCSNSPVPPLNCMQRSTTSTQSPHRVRGVATGSDAQLLVEWSLEDGLVDRPRRRRS